MTTKRLDKFHGTSMTIDRKIEATKTITSQAVRTTLQHLKKNKYIAEQNNKQSTRVISFFSYHSWRIKMLHDSSDNRLKNAVITLVRDSVVERTVHTVILSISETNITQISGSRKKLTILKSKKIEKQKKKAPFFSNLVQAQSHHSVRSIKCLFDSISMMDINVNVKNTIVFFEKLQNRQNAVIHITKARRLRLFGMVKPSRPIDGNVHRAFVELDCASERSSGVGLTILVQAVEQRTIVSDIEAHQLTSKVVARLRSDQFQKIHVIVRVKTGHVFKSGQTRTKHLQLLVQAVVENQIVGHSDAMRFHRMSLKKKIKKK